MTAPNHPDGQIYEVDEGVFVAANHAGWLSGTFATESEALSALHGERHSTHPGKDVLDEALRQSRRREGGSIPIVALDPNGVTGLASYVETLEARLAEYGNEDPNRYYPRLAREMEARAVAAEAERDVMAEALHRIEQWSAAYPHTVFTAPDLGKMRQILTDVGMPMSLDAAHGTWGRHIASGIGEIARAALSVITGGK